MLQQLSGAWRKILIFGLFGAAGCLVAALVLGEAFFWLTRSEARQRAVCLLLDCSGSMLAGGRAPEGELSSGGQTKLDEMKAAAIDYVERQHEGAEQIAVVGFGSMAQKAAPLGRDPNQLQGAIAALSGGGGTNMSAALSAAAAELDSSGGPDDYPARVILLFTDGMPDSQPLTLAEAQKCRDRDIQIVAVRTPDADLDYLSQVTGDPQLVFTADAGKFGEVFQQAEKAIKDLAGGETVAGREFLVFRIAGWTALLALGTSLALIAGQQWYLRKSLPSLRQAAIGAAGGLVVGMIAGALGQLAFTGAAESSGLLVVLGRLLGWTILGALLGLGLAFFVPNLPKLRGLAGGAAGGIVGAIVFVVLDWVLGATAGRLLGAAVLGFCIGAMIALIEAALREAWLEIHYGANEKRTVSLGAEPVSIGGDSSRCTVYAASAPGIALRYTLRDGRVTCEDVAAERSFDVQPGDRRRAGNLEVVVCAARSELAAASTAGPDEPHTEPVSRPTSRTTPVKEEAADAADVNTDAPFLLRIRGRRFPLDCGTQLTSDEIQGLETTSTDKVVAEVSSNPNDPRMLGLKNCSIKAWSATMPDGEVRQVPPGKTVRLTSHVRVHFGVLDGDIEEQNDHR
ncbi:MAG: VWA domain-containing protein [Pirellulaceae bacterium]